MWTTLTPVLQCEQCPPHPTNELNGGFLEMTGLQLVAKIVWSRRLGKIFCYVVVRH